MKKFFVAAILILGIFGYHTIAQKKFITRTGKIIFFSKAPLEDIRAVNNQVNCIYDTETNKIVAKVLINAFEFDKNLMQKHFNENYLESEKFPRAMFKGKIVNAEQLDFSKNWQKKINFEGDMTIHGVTKKIQNYANIAMDNGKLKINAEIVITLKDYDIKIPSTVINNIAEKVKVEINLDMQEFNN